LDLGTYYFPDLNDLGIFRMSSFNMAKYKTSFAFRLLANYSKTM